MVDTSSPQAMARSVWTSAGYLKDVPLPADIEAKARAAGYEDGFTEGQKVPCTVYAVFLIDDDEYLVGEPIVLFDTAESAEAYLSIIKKYNALQRKLSNLDYLELAYEVESLTVRRDVPHDDE
jgi:hypothetical protein